MPFCLGRVICKQARFGVLTCQAFPVLGKALPLLEIRVLFFLSFLNFELYCLLAFPFFADMAGSERKFTDVARVARKVKAIARATSPPAKRVRNMEEVIMLPPCSPPLAVEESILL